MFYFLFLSYVTLVRAAGCRDAVGRTPLHMGAMSGSLDTCRKLVSAGAVIDARDNLGRLALIRMLHKEYYLTVHRETSTQYSTFERGGRGESVLL
jgi:hypothetical protein